MIELENTINILNVLTMSNVLSRLFNQRIINFYIDLYKTYLQKFMLAIYFLQENINSPVIILYWAIP